MTYFKCECCDALAAVLRGDRPTHGLPCAQCALVQCVDGDMKVITREEFIKAADLIDALPVQTTTEKNNDTD